jgi:hypothetical protein
MCCKRRAFPVKVSATWGTGPDNASVSAETTADLSTASLTAVLGEVLIYLDPRLFAPAVNPSGLVKGVDESFDFVAALSQLLNGFVKLARTGCVLLQQPVLFVAAHPVS